MLDADNDDERRACGVSAHIPDIDGEAALLLVENLMHELIARGVLTVPVAMAVVDLAADAQSQLHEERGGAEIPDPAYKLHAISASLATELMEMATIP